MLGRAQGYIEGMRKAIRWSILSVWVLALSMALPYAHSSDASYESLSDVNDEMLFLGDVLTINAGWCGSSKKPSESIAKKRLEIYKSGKWTSVGKVMFLKSDICQKKTPYLKQFQWEVDELGIMNPDQISGKLRLRNSAVKPTIYSKVDVFESRSSYQDKLRADEEARIKAEEKKAQDARKQMNEVLCLLTGGKWSPTAGFCVPG